MLHTQQELQHFYNQLPKNLSVSNDIDKGHFKVNKKLAYKFQWITHRQDCLYSYIVVDYDASKSKKCWYDTMQESGLYPNIVVKNPLNNNGHLFFRLENSVSNYESSRSKPFDFYNVVRKAVTAHYGGDSQFTNCIAKNPVFKGKYYDKDNKVKTNKKVEVVSFNNDSWNLSDFIEYVDLYPKIEKQKQKQTSKEVDPDSEYRHDKTFNDIKLRAYAITHLYKKSGNREGLYNQIMQMVSNYQSRFNYPLSTGEQISTTKSITDYCMNPKNYIYAPKRSSNKRNVNFGRDSLKLSHLIETREKQIISASETNKQRVNDTERKIKNAIYSIKADDNKVTQKRIQEVSGLSIATVKRYSKLIKSLK